MMIASLCRRQFQTLVRHPLPQLPAADALAAVGGATRFAVIKLGGSQYKVCEDDLVAAERLPTAVVGGSVTVDEVLMLGSRDWTMVGQPLVRNAKVVLNVEEQTRDKTAIVFKKRRRKGYRRFKGHRRQVTLLRVESILADETPLPAGVSEGLLSAE